MTSQELKVYVLGPLLWGPGFGTALEAPAPFGTLIAIEWGYGARGVNSNGTLGTQVLRISGYKLF